MSNLIKFNSFVVKPDNSIVIDSNKKVIEKINQIQENVKNYSFVNGKADADGFVSGINAQVVETLVEPEQVDSMVTRKEAEDMLSVARNEADSILAQARSDAQSFIESAKEQGFAQGVKAAELEIEEKIKALEAEYSEKKRALDAEYEAKVAKIEPMLVDTLLRVFSKVTHTMAEDKKDMILCLINSVMRNTDISKEFYIRVSPEDYKFTLNNQSKIYSSVAKDVHIEISEDTSLGRNECIIETDAGVFDCSLDIQLENLIKDIRLLSCLNE